MNLNVINFMKTLIYISITFILFLLPTSSCSVLRSKYVISHTSNSVVESNFRGSLEKHWYPCSVNGPSTRAMYVYLPQTYYETDRRYPVLYLLHGANGNESSWIHKGEILDIIDSLSIIEEISECIYVFPNTNHYFNDYDYADSRELGSIDSYLGLDGSVEYAFKSDVVAYVDANFRTLSEKSYRAIAGLSLGGLQTIYISSCYPDEFKHVGLFSPLIHPPLKIGKYTSIYNNLEEKLKRQFLIAPNYWIMVGEADPYFNSSYFYSRLLQDNKFPHKFYISSGGHKWCNWKKYATMFIKELWRDDSPHNTIIILEN